MSLKTIFILSLFVILTVYFTYLNPQEVTVYFSQNKSFEFPLVVFMLVSLLGGALLTTALMGWNQIKSFFKTLRMSRRFKKDEKQRKKWEKISQKAENALATGHEQKGIALFEKILSSNPEHISSLNHVGNHLRAEGTLDKAIEMHRRAVELDPENVHALDNLSEDYAATQKPDKQINTLARILDLDPHSLPTLRKLRDAYLSQNNPEKAYQTQKTILPLIHDKQELALEQDLFSQIVYSRGFSLFKEKKFEQAIVEFKRSIRENNQSLPAYITLGDIYMECDNPKAALKTWRSGYDNTRSPICISRINLALEKLNKSDEILKTYREAIRASQNSDRETLVKHFAYFLLNEDKTDEALEMLETIPEPSLATRLLTIKALRAKDDLDEADKITQSTYEKVSYSLERYHCTQCKSLLEEWSGVCPTCQTWNSVVNG